MSENTLQDEIISDLSKDFPKIKNIEKKEHEIIISADNDTLWEIFEVLYNGMDNVEFNMEKDEDSFIIIKT